MDVVRFLVETGLILSPYFDLVILLNDFIDSETQSDNLYDKPYGKRMLP